jgi:hypothetical protein
MGRPIFTAGVIALLAAIPRLTIAVEAYSQLSQLEPSQLRFIDFEPAPWVTFAFIAAHAWLAWGAWNVFGDSRQPRSKALGVLSILVGLELFTVYCLSWAVRDHGVTVF